MKMSNNTIKKSKLISSYFFWDKRLKKIHLENVIRSINSQNIELINDNDLLLSYLNAIFLMSQELNCITRFKNFIYFDTGLESINKTRIIGFGIHYHGKKLSTFKGFFQEQFKELKNFPKTENIKLKFNSINFPKFDKNLIQNLNINNFPIHLYERLVKDYVYSKITRKITKNDRQIYEYKYLKIIDILYIVRNIIKKNNVYKYIKNKTFTYIVEVNFPLSKNNFYLGYLVFSLKNNKFYAKTYLTMNMVKGYVIFNDLKRSNDFTSDKIKANEKKRLGLVNG